MKSGSSIAGQALVLLCLFAFCSCRNSHNDDCLLQHIDEGLAQSNRLIRLASSDILEVIKQKTYQPVIAERAREIYLKAVTIQQQTDSIFNYIEWFKNSIKQNASSNIALKNIVGLHTRLIGYKRKVISVDKRLARDVASEIFIVSKEIDSSNEVLATLKKLLLNQPAFAAITYLRRIENNLSIDEQTALKFLHDQVTPLIDHFTVFSAIVGQNAQILEAGKILEVTAGIGSFTRYPIARITVDGHLISLNEKGFAIYQIKTLKKPGFYSVPVQIKFTDQDGNEQTKSIPVDYKTVSTHCK